MLLATGSGSPSCGSTDSDVPAFTEGQQPTAMTTSDSRPVETKMHQVVLSERFARVSEGPEATAAPQSCRVRSWQ